MISYSTEFPIDEKNSVQDVLKLACTWISGSPHTKLSAQDLANIINGDEGSLAIGSEIVTTGYASRPDYEIAGLRYTRLDNEIFEWVTTIVTSQTPSQHLLSIQVSCEALKTAPRLPFPKKPYFVRQVLEHLGGGMDGQIPVSNKAIFLSSGDERIAADLILGFAGNSLPIVYVSATPEGGHNVDPNTLAKWLSGMAHVIVEGDIAFSLKLKGYVSSRNVYGGTIGVYWPDSAARKSYYLSDENGSPQRLQVLIENDVRAALANRRQKTYCNWLHLKECISKSRYEKLKGDGSTEIEKFAEAFDGELAAKQEKLDEAESEIARLNSEIKKLTANQAGRDEGLLGYGDEQDLYFSEIKGFVLEALSASSKNTVEGSRKQHVMEDLLRHNESRSMAAKMCDEIKVIFRQYVDMDAKTKSGLLRLGFNVSEDGKHFKLVFQGDDRYTFAVSKTSSDHRAGKNFASDINKRLF